MSDDKQCEWCGGPIEECHPSECSRVPSGLQAYDSTIQATEEEVHNYYLMMDRLQRLQDQNKRLRDQIDAMNKQMRSVLSRLGV